MKEIWKVTIKQKSSRTSKPVYQEFCFDEQPDKRDQQQIARLIMTFEPKRGHYIESIIIEKDIVLI